MTTSNLTNNLPLCHWWQYSHSFSCSPCHRPALPIMMLFHFYLPLWHEWKRECLLMFSCLSFWGGITPNFCLRYSKVSLGRGLVKMSTICSFVSTYSSLMFFSLTCSLRKWNLMGMCFVLQCITGFLDMFIALVLSQSIGVGSSYFTCMSSNVFLI